MIFGISFSKIIAIYLIITINIIYKNTFFPHIYGFILTPTPKLNSICISFTETTEMSLKITVFEANHDNHGIHLLAEK